MTTVMDYTGHISRSGQHLPDLLEGCIRMEAEKRQVQKLNFVKSITVRDTDIENANINPPD